MKIEWKLNRYLEQHKYMHIYTHTHTHIHTLFDLFSFDVLNRLIHAEWIGKPRIETKVWTETRGTPSAHSPQKHQQYWSI